MIYIDKHIHRRLFSESLRAAASLWRGSTCTNWSYFFVLIQSIPTVRKQALASFEVGTHPRPPGRTTAIHTFQGKRRLLSKEVFRTWENPCTGRKWPKHNRTRHFLLVKHKALGAAWRTKKAWARGILAHFQEGKKKKKPHTSLRTTDSPAWALWDTLCHPRSVPVTRSSLWGAEEGATLASQLTRKLPSFYLGRRDAL